MASYTIAKTTESDDALRQIYNCSKACASGFDYHNLDIIFEIALANRDLFPNIQLSGNNTVQNYLTRWVGEYRSAITNPPSSRTAKPKTACTNPAIRKIVMTTQGIEEDQAVSQEKIHNLFMSAENIQGNLLEEYIAMSVSCYGWIWCAGNILRAIDFCSSDGKVLLQIKNKSNTENSSSSHIREGTSIQKWYRLGTRTVKGKKLPTYKWELLNKIINDHRTAGNQLPPCNMTEEQYISYLSQVAAAKPGIITAE